MYNVYSHCLRYVLNSQDAQNVIPNKLRAGKADENVLTRALALAYLHK